MTQEEVASVIHYCKESGITYKTRLAELGIPEWRFYSSKTRYAKVVGTVIRRITTIDWRDTLRRVSSQFIPVERKLY